ncbi:uncharacterized protein [Hetaerina americana]|uniref:uncharacterized protein n=1 Tax=Hetaerina americana TaxID=62018 RepID=UPI003A7F128D
MDVVLSTNMGVTHAAECSLMLALSYATKIAKENRELSCKFGESVLDIVLKCYDPTASEVIMLKSLVLEFLIFLLKIHHPNGAIMGSVGAYTHDRQKWENGLKQMYFLMREEIKWVRKRLSTEEPLLGRFLDFSVEVSYQMMNLSGEENDTDGPSNLTVAKESGIQMVISLLRELPEQSAWPWLYIISFLIRKYHCLDESSCILILDNLTAFISLSKDRVTLDCLFRCCCSVAQVQILNTDNMLEYENYWQKIWDLAVWAIGLKHCEDSAHETICAILTANCLTLKNQIAELFNMYLTDRMTPSEGSIKTLHCLLMSFNIVEGMDLTARESCMKWVYLAKEKHEAFQGMLPVELVADILVQLCLKGRLKRVPPTGNDSKVGPLEHFYSQMSFCNGLLTPCTSPPRNPECRTRGDVSLEEASFNTLMGMVTKDGESLVAWVNAILASGARKEGVSGAEFLSSQLQVLVLVSSNLIGCSACSSTAAEIASCLNVFKILLGSFTDLLEAIVKIPQLKNELAKTFGNLAALYEFQIDVNIMAFVREVTPRKLIEIVTSVITGGAGAMKDASPQYIRSSPEKYLSSTPHTFIDYYSILDMRVYSESTCLLSIGCKIMGAFCCKCDGKPYVPQQKEVLAYFIGTLSKETKEIGFPLGLQMLMEFLYLPIGRLAIDVEFSALTLSKFEVILAMHSNDVELLQIFLSLLRDIASKAVTNSAFQGIIVKSSEFYLARLYMGILKRMLPPSITVTVVQLLGTLIKILSVD